MFLEDLEGLQGGFPIAYYLHQTEQTVLVKVTESAAHIGPN